MFWVMHSGIIAAMAMVFARYAGVFVPLDDVGMRAVAVAAILVNSAINYTGVKRSSALQTSITVTKVVAVALIVVVGFALGSQLPPHGTPSMRDSAWRLTRSEMPFASSEFLLAVVAGLFAFGGWHVVTYTAEETLAPLVFVVASAAIVINRFAAFPLDSGAGLALVASAIPVYCLWWRPRYISGVQPASMRPVRD